MRATRCHTRHAHLARDRVDLLDAGVRPVRNTPCDELSRALVRRETFHERLELRGRVVLVQQIQLDPFRAQPSERRVQVGRHMARGNPVRLHDRQRVPAFGDDDHAIWFFLEAIHAPMSRSVPPIWYEAATSSA